MAPEITGIQPLAERIRGYFTHYDHHDSTREQILRQEERRRERTRIARELHDTLLQGLLSAAMQLQVAEGWLPPDSPAKPLLSRVRDLMGKGIAEGRAALQGLRSAEVPPTSLDQALSDFQEELTPTDRARLRIVKMGRPKPLDPAVLQQIYLIAREALLNSLRHSQAKKIEVEIEYSPRKLRVVVRDNGTGIDPQVLHSGRKSHYGLTGMRERATTIGAHLRIWSKRKAGTELELSLLLAIGRLPHP
ncbi:MAG TPA: histidine kinase [Candidatus Acidoferrales bacterium]|jgi:signal transduction histidine kinase|nr:histidine kinase [Candidatus Acidoferrales bacterium]